MLQAKMQDARDGLIQKNGIPSLPQGWDVQRLRFLFRESKERNGVEPVGDMLSVSEYRGVVPRDYEHDEQRRTDEELQTYRVVRAGQLAVNTMWLNHLGLGVSEHLGHVSPAYAVYDISPRLDKRYTHHLLRSQYYLKIYLRYLYGIRPNSFQIKTDDWNSIPIILPPIETQKAIADFLDRETARIDQLIEKKQLLVERLTEKLSATIHAGIANATCGLVQPLHRFCRIVTGKTPSRTEDGHFSDGEGLPWATPTNLGSFEPITETKEMLTETGIVGQVVVPCDTVLVNGIGASVGKIGISGRAMSFNQQIHGILPNKDLLLGRFLFFVMLTKKEEIVSLASNTTIPIINADRFGRIVVPLPPFDVQRAVISTLDDELVTTRDIRLAIEKSINCLREFRSALITAAVTGQIDVTTWGKRGNADRRLEQIEADFEQAKSEVAE